MVILICLLQPIHKLPELCALGMAFLDRGAENNGEQLVLLNKAEPRKLVSLLLLTSLGKQVRLVQHALCRHALRQALEALANGSHSSSAFRHDLVGGLD